MSTVVPPLTWSPYQGGAAGTLVAVVNLDSAVDSDFIVPVTGTFKTPASNIVVADSVVIFNTKNNGDVDVRIGGLGTIDIPAFVRDTIQLSNSNPQTIEVTLNFVTGTVQLQFYKGTPPVTPQLYNYLGAVLAASGSAYQALNNDVLLTNTALYFDGPSVTLTQGTWHVTGKVCAHDTAHAGAAINIRLVDNLNVIYDSNSFASVEGTLGYTGSVSAIIMVGSGTLDITLQAQDTSSGSGFMLWNQSGNGRDTSIAASQIS